MSQQRGKFITLEGSEGVGKTTSLQFIKQYLESKGINVIVTREPGGTPLAEDIRALLLSNRQETVDIDAELLLMFAARCQHVNALIKPALEDGDWVLCDRFVDATYAYQGGGRGIAISRIESIENWSLAEFEPDLTILLDMSVEEGMARTRLRGRPDRFETEQIEFFERIRQVYLSRASQYADRIKVVDAAPSQAEVQSSIARVLAEFI